MATKLNVGQISFDGLRTNLKNFLAEADEFQGFDFDGTAISLIIDILAYNSYYYNQYLNLTVNESFLDSASKRDSVVSLAKMLGYIPRSASASRATIAIDVGATAETPDEIRILKNSPFTTSVDGETYTFYADNEYSARKVGNNYSFNRITLIEGTPVSERFTYSSEGLSRFLIRNQNIDVGTLQISIQPNETSADITNFTRAENLLELNNNSAVYFLREVDNGEYEISFGDGILGRALENGNVVNISYFITNTTLPNKAGNFTYNGDRLGDNVVTITTLDFANGGREREEVESIRHNAPRYFASQDRAVTVNDYAVLLSQNFPFVKTLNIYGGEDNLPAIYGRVFIAIGGQDRSFITSTQKQSIITYLRGKNVVSVIPEVVDAEYVLLEVSARVSYDSAKTSYTENDIAELVVGVIENYDSETLQTFGGVFRYSNLVSQIDRSHESINSNSLSVVVRRDIRPAFDVNAEYDINLLNPITEGGLTTTGFRVSGSNIDHYLDDNNGIVRLYNSTDGVKTIVRNVGAVDYERGIIKISNLNITTATDNLVSFRIVPASDDIIGNLNQIVEVDKDKLKVDVVKENV